MTNQVVNYYLKSGLGAVPRRTWQDPDTAPGNDIVKLLDIRIRSEQNNITDPISGYKIQPQKEGKGYIDCIIPVFPFTSGIYYIRLGTVKVMQQYLHTVEKAAVIEVQGADFYGSGVHLKNNTGFFVCNHSWSFNKPIA